MSEVMRQIHEFMERQGIPGRDLHDLPSSPLTFPDGAHYRIEIAGVERPSTMAAMIDEARKRGVTVHRAIATVGGSTYCDMAELRDMAQMARDEHIEVIMTVGHRKGWDAGAREAANPEGALQGFRLRGSDHVAYHIADLMRSVEAGFRGFLVYDEGVLSILSAMRAEGILPAETFFKFSVFGGYCSPAGAKVVAAMGADSLNPSSDVSLPILASLRRTVTVPLDVYISIVDSFGGQFRAYEAAEIARVASPCYFKIEPGTSEGEIYKPWVPEPWHADFVRMKVKLASITAELVNRHAPNLRSSAPGAADLRLPAP